MIETNNQIQSQVSLENKTMQWTVVGAGPAGIAVIGLLLDIGTDPQNIAWIDPEFNVGRLSNYLEVPANSTIASFMHFMRACKIFGACHTPAIDALMQYDQNKEYSLQTLVAPLQDLTKFLCSQVVALKNKLLGLDFENNVWKVIIGNKTFFSERVVLATGSHPRSLHYECSHEIPLDIALNKSQLMHAVQPTDSIAVVGSAHSAVLVMKFLTEVGVARIINFFNKPLLYMTDMGTWFLHAETGLKGVAAEWAKNVLEKNPPANLMRVSNSPAALKEWLPLCNKIVYAIGFDRNELPPINGVHQSITHDHATGVIAPHLFGIGIAFPEQAVDPVGNVENRVGLNQFMEYAQRVVPEWMHKDVMNRFKSCENLFMINLL